MNRTIAATPRGGRPLVVVDLGGTWVRVSVSGAAPRAYRGPTPGVAGLPALLARLWRRWRLARRDLAALGVASRGIWTRGERLALARRLRRFAPRVIVISDVEAAYLAALGAVPGVLLLAGTGSIALGRDGRGRWTREGGLGPLLGDDGSAFSIGRAWLRDAVGPARALRLRPPVTLSWAGGLLGHAPFRAGVWRHLRGQGLRIRPVRPKAPAASPSAWRAVFPAVNSSREGPAPARSGTRAGRSAPRRRRPRY